MWLACLALGLAWAAAAGAEPLYRLPWPEGATFMFTQAPGGRITSHFAGAHLHAVDIAMPEGTPVLAARAGIVEALDARHGAVDDEEPLTYEGNFVRVRHADGTVATYAHLKHAGVAVRVGESVEAGQVLGQSGFTGDIREPHLHFGVTRTVRNASGWSEEVSLPVTFYVGEPALAFRPRAALMVKASYSSPAEHPRAPSEVSAFAARKPPTLAPEDEFAAWAMLGAWLASTFAGLAAFWLFSRSGT